MALLDAILKRWPLYALLASAAMLAIAHGFQTFGGLAPCHLCLQQREAYWWALAVSGVAVVVALVRPAAPAPRIASLMLACVFGYGAYLAAFQTGAEWKWWPAPVTCASGGAKVSAADLKALMSGHAVAMPPCDKAAWVFLGLSMAGWNFLASVGLVVLSLAAALKRTPA